MGGQLSVGQTASLMECSGPGTACAAAFRRRAALRRGSDPLSPADMLYRDQPGALGAFGQMTVWPSGHKPGGRLQSGVPLQLLAPLPNGGRIPSILIRPFRQRDSGRVAADATARVTARSGPATTRVAARWKCAAVRRGSGPARHAGISEKDRSGPGLRPLGASGVASYCRDLLSNRSSREGTARCV